MRFDANGGRAKNYEPTASAVRSRPASRSTPGSKAVARARTHRTGTRRTTTFSQAGALYRLMSAEEKTRLVNNIAGSLAQVQNEEIVARSIGHFRNADPDTARASKRR